MKYVRITKIQHRPDAKVPAAAMDSWKHGTEHPDNVSLPVDYTVEGWVRDPPTVGKSLGMTRRFRNGIEALGFFQTSPVKEIGKGRLDGFNGEFYTENSVYRIEPVKPPTGPMPLPRIVDDATTY